MSCSVERMQKSVFLFFFFFRKTSVTFEIKSGFVGLQRKVISSRKYCRAWKQMPGVSRGMNRARLERAQMSLRQVGALLAAGIQQSFRKTGRDVALQTAA